MEALNLNVNLDTLADFLCVRYFSINLVPKSKSQKIQTGGKTPL